MKQTIFVVADLCCPTEEQIIRNRLKRVDGIDRLDFNLMARELTVTHDLNDEGILQGALDSLGMGARLKPATPDAAHADGASHEHSAAVSNVEKLALALSGATAIAAEAVAWTTHSETSWPVISLAVVSIALGGRGTLRKGFTALRTLTLNINFLMSLAVAGAVFIGQWPEAAMVTFLFGLAEMIEAYSLERARNAIGGLMELSPQTATAQEDGQWREVKAESVQVGQTVRVRPGERIPLDGAVTAGASSVNQAPITGESIPVEKKPGDTVFAGSVNERGTFEFRVTANKGNTTLARIIRTVQEAQGQRAPTQRFIDRFAHYYTPGVVLFAVAVAALPPLFFGQPFAPWLYKALVMLVIACPCALVISTPVTVVSGLAAAARRGILIKGGVYLEEGRRLKVVALDKTGTLTHGKPVVTDIVPLNEQTAKSLLQLAASLDSLSEHPVASAIVTKWTGVDVVPAATVEPLINIQKSGRLLPVTEFEALAGRGVRGIINGRNQIVGWVHRSFRDVTQRGPSTRRHRQHQRVAGTNLAWMCRHDALLGSAPHENLTKLQLGAAGRFLIERSCRNVTGGIRRVITASQPAPHHAEWNRQTLR